MGRPPAPRPGPISRPKSLSRYLAAALTLCGVPPSQQDELTIETALDVVEMGWRMRRVPSAVQWGVDGFEPKGSGQIPAGLI